MSVTKYTVFRTLDILFLCAVYVLQSVILSQYTVYFRYHSELPSDYVNPVSQKLLWLTGDLICLAGFVLACLCGFRHVRRQRNLRNSLSGGGSDDAEGSLRLSMSTKVEEGEPVPGPSNRLPNAVVYRNSLLGYLVSHRTPMIYLSWFSYASFLVLKIVLIFTSDLSEKWRENESLGVTAWFGPQVLQLGIGMSAVIFSLLVEAHHDAGYEDPKRNAYLNSVSYEVALEILDTACLLSFLISSFDHEAGHVSQGEECPITLLTPPIIALSAVNLLLPTVVLYKLTSTNFAESYHVQLEIVYKTFHFLFVNLPFLLIRIYLWHENDREEVIFMIKNVYGIVSYFRGLYSDVQILRKERNTRVESTTGDSVSKKAVASTSVSVQNRRQDGNAIENGNSVELKRLM